MVAISSAQQAEHGELLDKDTLSSSRETLCSAIRDGSNYESHEASCCRIFYASGFWTN
jgi:hypothetical protein